MEAGLRTSGLSDFYVILLGIARSEACGKNTPQPTLEKKSNLFTLPSPPTIKLLYQPRLRQACLERTEKDWEGGKSAPQGNCLIQGWIHKCVCLMCCYLYCQVSINAV